MIKYLNEWNANGLLKILLFRRVCLMLINLKVDRMVMVAL